MTSLELLEIEKELDIILPEYYRRFQIAYPQQLIELKFNEEYFSNDPKWLTEINSMIRSNVLFKDFFCIGMNGGGDSYFIKTNGYQELVYLMDHEEASEIDENELTWEKVLKIEHSNLNEFKDWLITSWGDYFVRFYEKND